MKLPMIDPCAHLRYDGDKYNCARGGVCKPILRGPDLSGCPGFRQVGKKKLTGAQGEESPCGCADAPATAILLTGGIGDVIACESMMAPEFREKLETIYYACPAPEVQELFRALPNYPRLKNHVAIATKSKTFHSREAVEVEHGKLPAGVEDWSILKAFAKKLPYQGSSFLQYRLAESVIEGPYVVIVPSTTWGRMEGRDFDAQDWKATLAMLEAWNLRGVVLTRDPCEIPNHPRLGQFQLPILEAIEAVKGASGYIGIDSWVSILAAKLFPAERLRVKSVNPQFHQWKETYHAPRKHFGYLARGISAPEAKAMSIVSEEAVHPHHADERAELFTAHDGGSIEVEFGELLAALVRSFKPAHVLETGTYLGIAARIISQACRRNGFGKLTTLEVDRDRAAKAKTALADMPNVEVVQADSVKWLQSYAGPPFGLIVLDSDLPVRIEELRIIRERGLAEGPVFIHDTSRLRADGGSPDYPEFPAKLDAFALPGVECHLSRGWRLLDLRAI